MNQGGYPPGRDQYAQAPYGANPYGVQMGGPMMASMPGVWTCPFCRYQGAPMQVPKVSTAGWIVFVLLLILCIPICWLGLLMRENTTHCPSCRTKIGG